MSNNNYFGFRWKFTEEQLNSICSEVTNETAKRNHSAQLWWNSAYQNGYRITKKDEIFKICYEFIEYTSLDDMMNVKILEDEFSKLFDKYSNKTKCVFASSVFN